MLRYFTVATLALICLGIPAQGTKTEDDIRTAQKENIAMIMRALAELSARQSAPLQPPGTKADVADKVRVASQEASRMAEAQTAAIRAADESARNNAAAANDSAATLKTGNTALMITQIGIFLALIAGYIYKGWERHVEIAEAVRKDNVIERRRLDAITAMTRLQDDVADHAQATVAQLNQIHTLVNSNMTAAKQGELNARIDNFALLNQLSDVKSKFGFAPSPEITSMIEATKKKIDYLTAELSDRLIQTTRADMQLRLDLQQKPAA